MNFCFLSGPIMIHPILRFTKTNNPITNFTLSLGENQPPAYGMTILCIDEMAMSAAQYLRVGDIIGVDGFLSRRKIVGEDGKEVIL